MPPNGVSGVEMATELTPTMPDWMASPMAVGGRARRGEGIGREPERQRVGALDHLVEGLERHDRRHRPERLLGHDLGVVRHVGDHRRLEEEALVAVARAAGRDLAAAALGVVDEDFHGVEPARIGERAHAWCPSPGRRRA